MCAEELRVAEESKGGLVAIVVLSHFSGQVPVNYDTFTASDECALWRSIVQVAPRHAGETPQDRILPGTQCVI